MKIPHKLLEKIIKENIFPGNVIKFKVTFLDGVERYKRCIILTYGSKTTFLFLVTTTKSHNKPNRYQKDDLQIPPNTEKSFDKNTYIDLSRVLEENTKRIIDEYVNQKNNEKIIIKNKISKTLLNKIYHIITNSYLIKQKYISRVLQEKNYI